jgi:hypothetical protein
VKKIKIRPKSRGKPKRVSLVFQQCIQDSQEYGSTDEHMVSGVYFDVVRGDRVLAQTHATIKQTVGTSFEAEPLEVTFPPGTKLPVRYTDARTAAEDYYRRLIGRSGQMIRVEDGTNLRMYNNTMVSTWAVELDEVNPLIAGW